MKKNKLLRNLATRGLVLFEKHAQKKASAECQGILFEPKVPKKLKKTICMVLVCVLTVTGVLAGSVGTYKAADYNYALWTTLAAYPGAATAVYEAALYDTIEKYEWAVTEYSAPSGYGLVTLGGVNNTVIMTSGTNQLTQIGTRQFTRVNPKDTTEDDPYMYFRVTLSYDSYTTRYTGYLKLVNPRT